MEGGIEPLILLLQRVHWLGILVPVYDFTHFLKMNLEVLAPGLPVKVTGQKISQINDPIGLLIPAKTGVKHPTDKHTNSGRRLHLGR